MSGILSFCHRAGAKMFWLQRGTDFCRQALRRGGAGLVALIGVVLVQPAYAAKPGALDLSRSYDSLPRAERRAVLSAVAEESFATLINVMPDGLRKSVSKIERVSRYRDWLDASSDPLAHLLALSLQQGIDRAVIVELYRAAAARSGVTPGYSVTPNSVDGELVEKLLAQNWFDPEKKLEYALRLDGVCAHSAKSQGWKAPDFLRGKASFAGVLYGYEQELALTRETLLTGVPNLTLTQAEIADQIFSATTFAIDRGRDVRIFASIHRDLATLPKDRAAFDAAVVSELKARPAIRVLTADPTKTQDIEATMRNYAHPVREEFVKNLAPAFLPFVQPSYELPKEIFQDASQFLRWRGLWLPQ